LDRVVQHRLVILICALLAAATLWIYWQTLDFQFTHHDDNVYVTDNPEIKTGLSLKTVATAFTSTSGGMWMPLVRISYAVDYAFGEMDPQVFHLHNLVLHLANVLLLFLLLVRLTRSIWPSAFAAALFAVHPLRVESVAWIAERKDVQSTLLWLLTTFAYIRYVEQTTIGRYLLMALVFALGLLSKPMLVTLPVTLLLLDYWPLGRFSGEKKMGFRRLALEKLPLLGLAAVAGTATYLVMAVGNTDASHQLAVAAGRPAGAVFAYLFYLIKLVRPTGLAFHYPPSATSPTMWVLALGAIGLIIATLAALRVARRCPYVAVGWLWYAITLFPVSGAVMHARGLVYDHFAYVPHIGICIAISWGLATLLKNLSARLPRVGKAIQLTVVPAGAVALLLILAWMSRAQTAHWRNDFTLFGHAIRVTKHNAVAHFDLGNSYAARGDLKEATRHYRLAIAADPRKDDALMNLGALLLHDGKVKEALYYLRRSEAINPDVVETQITLANALMSDGKYKDAVRHFEAALKLRPKDPDIESDLETARELAGLPTGRE